MTKLIDIYHRLPQPLRAAIVNLRGLQLRHQRFGPIFHSALPGILERTNWPRDQWEAWQLRRLATLLDTAQKYVKAYEAIRSDVRPTKIARPSTFWPGGGKEARNILARWPELDREWCRQHVEELLDRRKSHHRLLTVYTSGTTGSPQRLYRDGEAQQLTYAYAEVRWNNLAGVSRLDRWAAIGGKLIVPVTQHRPPFWVTNRPLRQLYLSAYHMKDENGEAYLDAIENFEPAFLYGYASSLYWLAQQAERLGRRLPIRLVLSNAEPLFVHQRKLLHRAFDCHVRDTYGSAEGIAQGFECAAGRMHVSPDFGVLEILRSDGVPCLPGEVGRIVCTGLNNRAMLMVRYITGDAAAWAEDQTCRCGCSFPILEQIEGRTDDLLETGDGRTVGRLDPVFKADMPIREAQIIQRPDLSLQVLVVPEPNFSSIHENEIISELRARMGQSLPITVRRVSEIERTSSGKFQAVVRER